MIYDSNNIFSSIIKAEIPCIKIYEDEFVLAFNDLHPAAPVHILAIPKGNYCSYDDFVVKAKNDEIVHFFRTVKKIANEQGLGESGYRLIMNHGDDALQSVKHFHVHILGKKNLGPLIVGDEHHK